LHESFERWWWKFAKYQLEGVGLGVSRRIQGAQKELMWGMYNDNNRTDWERSLGETLGGHKE